VEVEPSQGAYLRVDHVVIEARRQPEAERAKGEDRPHALDAASAVAVALRARPADPEMLERGGPLCDRLDLVVAGVAASVVPDRKRGARQEPVADRIGAPQRQPFVRVRGRDEADARIGL